jgi:release factor glutamine methyltransferase
MLSSPTNVLVSWVRVTGASSELVSELVAAGVDRREARWLVDEFAPGGDPDARVALQAAAKRRLNGEPLQYVIGRWPFRSLELDLDSRVLIPRPETEELVDVALGELARCDVAAPVILDLGCGSGAIGFALLDELRTKGIAATLIAVDQSSDALAVAKRNALKHSLHNVSFVHSSWFDELDDSLRGRIDLLVTNPPYVGAEELQELDPVLLYEPRGALVAGDEGGVIGFADIAFIVACARTWLREGGALVLEHGETHGDAAQRAARDAGFREVTDVTDLAGKPRVLVAR